VMPRPPGPAPAPRRSRFAFVEHQTDRLLFEFFSEAPTGPPASCFDHRGHRIRLSECVHETGSSQNHALKTAYFSARLVNIGIRQPDWVLRRALAMGSSDTADPAFLTLLGASNSGDGAHTIGPGHTIIIDAREISIQNPTHRNMKNRTVPASCRSSAAELSGTSKPLRRAGPRPPTNGWRVRSRLGDCEGWYEERAHEQSGCANTRRGRCAAPWH
jgi:hypothetical protein